MYYLLISIAVVMFGGTFWTNDLYRQKCGSGLAVSLKFTFISSLAGLIALSAINGFKPEFTTFTFIMALLKALNGFGFTFCSFKALGSINLSLYSLFSMLGGMVLPFVSGILFFREGLTLAKAVCLILITVALVLTVKRGEKRGGLIYYAGIFILNGMSGVLTQIFTDAPFEKTSAAGFSMLSALVTVVISFIACLFLKRPSKEETRISTISIAAASGVINKIANYLLVLSLMHLHASVQYPMVTGGTMIVSTVIAALGKKKPSKREIISVIIAFVAILLLVIIPI